MIGEQALVVWSDRFAGLAEVFAQWLNEVPLSAWPMQVSSADR